VLVSGCGGGASGAIDTVSGRRGRGGGAGGHALKHPVPIASGVASVSVEIGTGGPAVSGSAITPGAAGGHTVLTVGAVVLTLRGATPLRGGVAHMGAASGLMLDDNGDCSIVGEVLAGSGVTGRLSGSNNLPTLGRGGMNPTGGSALHDGFGGGNPSPFGAGGAGISTAPSGNTFGAAATGYGSGGAGAHWASGDTVSSGAGAPGILILEFVEGF
jgi:hypothetical protein